MPDGESYRPLVINEHGDIEKMLNLVPSRDSPGGVKTATLSAGPRRTSSRLASRVGGSTSVEVEVHRV